MSIFFVQNGKLENWLNSCCIWFGTTEQSSIAFVWQYISRLTSCGLTGWGKHPNTCIIMYLYVSIMYVWFYIYILYVSIFKGILHPSWSILCHCKVPPGVPATDRIVEIGGRPDAKAEGEECLNLEWWVEPGMEEILHHLCIMPCKITG